MDSKYYDPKIAEKKWKNEWEKQKIYAFDKKQKNIYSIDTPPPYASAAHLHVGHGMHYSQFEFIARYQRMQGKNVFFPMGYDDNGLPTERYVEKKHNVNKGKITRKEFIKLCLEETKKAGKNYYDLFTDLGFSIDWSLLYQTIGDRARTASQQSFIDLHNKGRLERVDQPAMWCMKCQTTIAQADLENVDMTSHFTEIIFPLGGKDLIIATTRPELIPACAALFYHPDDERYKSFQGKFAKVPLFDYEVPLLADKSVNPEKGTGLMMVCTWGDAEDVEKWHKYHLETRVIFTEYGKLNDLGGKFKGMKIKEARKAILEDLQKEKKIVSQKNISHAVNTHERCGTEIEFLKKPQWQIKVLDKKRELIATAKKIKWYPKHMQVRYEHWVKNLNWEWGISRQRYYGVPFPVWYCKQCSKVLLPEVKDLPVDPREEKYKGSCTCGSKDVVPEMDVMDTWMTSSNTPEVNACYNTKDELKGFLPMSLRPQAHDIIRTWAFYTIVKSLYQHNKIPWKDIMVSGHGLGPHGHKMSKSKGNFIVAQDVIKQYSADAFRYWSASGKLGDDLSYHEKDVKTGQKTVNKLWNASKLVFMNLEGYDKKKPKQLEVMDKWLLSKLQKIVKLATDAFDDYEFSKVKSEVDNFFWNVFCDYYLEIVKERLYNPEKRGKEAKQSAQYTLHYTLQTILKLFAPIMPFITEEIYMQHYAKEEKVKSIHVSKWPVHVKPLVDKKAEAVGDAFVEVLTYVRQEKSKHNKPLNTEILLTLDKKTSTQLKSALDDLQAAAKAKEIKQGSTSLSFL